MKKQSLFPSGKALIVATLGLGLITFAACDFAGSNGNNEGTTEKKEAAVAPEVKVDGNTLTYGGHSYTVNGEINFESKEHKTPTASVTFTNIPSDFTEFEAVYNNLLGKSPQGAAAMIPMAIELYARDAAVGKQCFELLCNGSATSDGILRILKTKLVPSEYAPENDSYIQRYMAAALLKGAENKNAYTPEEPYTVEMCSSPNGVKDAPLTGGTVSYLYILAHGWDGFQRSVDVLQPYNSEYYKISNCSSTYTQCKNIIGTWPGLK